MIIILDSIVNIIGGGLYDHLTKQKKSRVTLIENEIFVWALKITWMAISMIWILTKMSQLGHYETDGNVVHE
jgi:hypothetical protein